MPVRYRTFEVFLREVRPVLVRHHGAARADEIVVAARPEYERLRPQVPDIGGRRNVFQGVMTTNGWIVALHRAMREHGLSAADSVRACQEAFDAWLRRKPAWLLRAIGRLALSRLARRYFERQARRSQEKRYTEDFVWRVEHGPGGEISMVFDECAVNKWYAAQDVRELSPYCNFADVTYSRLMNMGVDAHETLGQGCGQCALRFQHGRATEVPKNLHEIVPAS